MIEPKVSIIILNWNGLNDTIECLESVRKIDYPNYEIVVVDNGSTDGSAEGIKRLFPEITLIRNKENLGYAGGNNVGIRYALKSEADYIFLLNNDTIVRNETILNLVQFFEKEHEYALASPLIFNYFKPAEIESYGSYVNPDTGRVKLLSSRQQYNCLSGAALMVRCDSIKNVGLLDERFFLYYEDTDWCFRFSERKYKFAIVETSVVLHKHGSSGGGNCSPLSLYYSIRNKRLFCEKRKPRNLNWLLKYYIKENFKLYSDYCNVNDKQRTIAVLGGIYDGKIKKYGKKSKEKNLLLFINRILSLIVFIIFFFTSLKSGFKTIIKRI